MAKKFYKNEKFQKILYPVLYFIYAVAFVIVGCFVFERLYYTNVYISGSSMMPTLLGGNNDRWHYGISDNHKSAIDNIKRFDVVLTYYPANWTGGDEDTTYKIKRVWGFPGETISLSKSENEYTFMVSKDGEIKYTISAPIEEKTYDFGNWHVAKFNVGHKTFYTHADTTRQFNVTLSEEKQEYFVMGDNWSASSDSYSHLSSSLERLTYSNLQGKMIAIQGTAKLVGKDLTDKRKIYGMYNF